MKKVFFLSLFAIASACARQPADAPAPKALSCEASENGSVTVEGAWLREQKDATAMSAGYFSVCNGTMAPVVLTGAATPAASVVELHETTRDAAGVVSMAPAGDIELKPGERVVFAPGGKHAMLMGLAGPISSGDEFPFILEFAGGAPVETIAVAKSNVEAAADADSHGGH